MVIKKIENAAVQKISSGQVITDIATVAKELLENSLDAHASYVEVRFRNSGLESLEVIDDGTGIAPDDYAGIARKHHTSKLQHFEDLENVSTLGFRGEAMSSLCALADVEITTCQNSSGLATKLVFDHHGEITDKSNTTGKKGTHVKVTNIFHNVPVRRRDLEKNIKREFTKALNLIQSYAIISEGIKIMVTQIKENKARSVVLATNGGNLQENLAAIYGTSSITALTPFELSIEYRPRRIPLAFQRKPEKGADNRASENGSDENDSDDYEMNEDDEKKEPVTTKHALIKGYVSQPIFGKGRTSSDRQLISVNGRPCVLPKFTRAIVETYKQFNTVQTPCIVADLQISPTNYDVNVAPDKRTLLIHDEAEIVTQLRNNFASFFDQFGHTVPTQDLKQMNGTMRVSVGGDVDFTPLKSSTEPSQDSLDASKSSFDNSHDSLRSSRSLATKVSTFSPLTSTSKVRHEHRTVESLYEKAGTSSPSSRDTIGSVPEKVEKYPERNTVVVESIPTSDSISEKTTAFLAEPNSELFVGDLSDEEEVETAGDQVEQTEDTTSLLIDNTSSEPEVTDAQTKTCCDSPSETENSNMMTTTQPVVEKLSLNKINSRAAADIRALRTLNETVQCDISFGDIKSGWYKTDKIRNTEKSGKSASGITTFDILENADIAEKRLNTIVKKDDFNQMRIIGQFNRGFILVARPKEKSAGSDLFIVDQHASDEKYNFERYQREIVMDQQPMFVPQTLNLSVIEEFLLQNNMDILKKNGFKIEVDTSQPPGQKCMLVGLPTSNSTVFDINDLYELLGLIGEKPGDKAVRCSKVRSMLAMRACRTSIMIGDSLDFETMETTVRHLAGLDKPWNCPHGRPTLRHLTFLAKDNGFLEDLSKGDLVI